MEKKEQLQVTTLGKILLFCLAVSKSSKKLRVLHPMGAFLFLFYLAGSIFVSIVTDESVFSYWKYSYHKICWW